MSSSKSFSAGGAIRGAASFGFDDKDLPPEGFDNSSGAGAKQIRMIIEENKQCIFVDDGPGMDRKKLESRFTLFKDKEASDDCQGRFGIGENVKHSLLTGNEMMSVSLSRTRNHSAFKLSQIELDWPTAANRDTDEFVLHASDASSANEELWKKYAIDPTSTGTIDIIPLCSRAFKYFTEQVKDYIPHYERMYTKQLQNGLSIEITVLGEHYILSGHDILVDEEVDRETTKDSDQLDVWQLTNGDLRVYFKNSLGKFVYKEKNSTKHITTYPPKKEEGYTHVGTLLLQHAYNPRWRKHYDLGGIYYKRNNKMIDKHPVPEPKGGDFWEQDILKSSRTVVTFSVNCDNLFGLEINKSRMKNIKQQLKEEIERFAHQFAKKVYKDCRPAPVVPVVPGNPNPIIMPAKTDGTLDGLIQINKTKVKAEVPVPVVIQAMARPDFLSKYIPELKTILGLKHQDAFKEAGNLWQTYKTTGVLPTIVKPTTTLEPTSPPPPTTNIQFSKNLSDSTLTITEGTTVLYTLYYVGQAHIWENNLKQILDAVGPARFKEYAHQLVLLNTNYLK